MFDCGGISTGLWQSSLHSRCELIVCRQKDYDPVWTFADTAAFFLRSCKLVSIVQAGFCLSVRSSVPRYRPRPRRAFKMSAEKTDYKTEEWESQGFFKGNCCLTRFHTHNEHLQTVHDLAFYNFVAVLFSS